MKNFKKLTMYDENIETTTSNSTTPLLGLDNVSNLLPCPFCGGKVIEEKPHWNMANAKCTECNNEWGHCGSQYEGRFDKWNKRAM